MAGGMTPQAEAQRAAAAQQRKSMQMLLLGAGGMLVFFLLGLGAMFLLRGGDGGGKQREEALDTGNTPGASSAAGAGPVGVVPLELPGDAAPGVAPVRPEGAVVDATVLHGGVGLGTWDTTAEFRDMVVEGMDKKVLFKPDFLTGMRDWKIIGGSWDAAAGVMSQNARSINCKVTAGFPEWQDYTYSFKAKRVDGTEGFLVIFAAEKENTLYWWNIGGWGNTRSAVEKMTNGAKREIPGSAVGLKIESDRWYAIKVELHGNTAHLSIDGTLITTLEGMKAHSTMPDAGPPTVFNNGDGPTARATAASRPAATRPMRGAPMQLPGTMPEGAEPAFRARGGGSE